jgi:hypothetical protein
METRESAVEYILFSFIHFNNWTLAMKMISTNVYLLLLLLFMFIIQIMTDNIRSIQMSIINDKIFQCAQSTCLPFHNVTTLDILHCQIGCLNQYQCIAATFNKSTSNCQLFNDSLNQNGNMTNEINVVTMITIFGTRYPPGLYSIQCYIDF